MHKDHQTFIIAIHEKVKVNLRFFSKEDQDILQRKCAPMDYAISRRYKDNKLRYTFWDYESDEGPHPLLLLPEQIESLYPTEERFDPGEFVTWDTQKSPWNIKRKWGPYS